MNTRFYLRIYTLFLILLSTAIISQAATISVTNKNNSGAGSLRQAVSDANNGDKIVFAAGLSGAIVLASPIILNKNLTIRGRGVNILAVEGQGLPTESRVFEQTAGSVLIADLRISKGISFDDGGGILVSGGNLTLNNCRLSENVAEFGGGGGALVLPGGTLTITNSTISGNSATVEGGGVSNRGGTLFLINSTIYGNVAPRGGGVSAEGLTGNTTILNSTISGNMTGDDSTSNVGGLRAFSNTVNIKNTIVANNSAARPSLADLGVSIENVSGFVNSQGTNLIGTTTGPHGFIASDLINVEPLLGVLANHGGGTFTVSLLPGSPAIDAGNNSGAPATDQRGVARPQGAAVDIGAYESGVNPAIFGKIAFVRNGNDSEIFSMNADGSNQTNLTNNAAFDSQPNWSPDGSKIAFISDRASFGSTEIYTMNANGSNPTRLTTNSVTDETPAWSPDGARIAFARSGQIFVMNADGTSVIQMTANSFSGAKSHPSWSPDGTRIVFHRNGGFSNFGIYVIDAACINCTSGNRLDNDIPSDNFDPVWSSDGTIAFSNDQLDFDDHSQPYTFLLYDFNVPPRPLASVNNPRIFSPAWSPDGTKLVYSTNSDRLSIINADGTNPTQFGASGSYSLPSWGGSNSPSGANVTAISGTTSITFSGISNPGMTTAVPINPADAGTLPGGYSLGANFPAYEISTTATFTAPITICLQVPAVTNAMAFAGLRILHNEGGTLVDRTILSPDTPAPNFATKTICARVNSLSPFVVANSAPTAAAVSVSGRIKNTAGRGIHLAHVSITDLNGETRTTLTNFYGFYRFDDVLAGETYVISVRHKQYQFSPQVITVLQQIQNADFTAEP